MYETPLRSRAGTVANYATGDAIFVRLNVASILCLHLESEPRFGGCQALRDNLSRLTVSLCVSTSTCFNVIRPAEDSVRLRIETATRRLLVDPILMLLRVVKGEF
jgi:hypothetical protein